MFHRVQAGLTDQWRSRLADLEQQRKVSDAAATSGVLTISHDRTCCANAPGTNA